MNAEDREPLETTSGGKKALISLASWREEKEGGWRKEKDPAQSGRGSRAENSFFLVF